jgi:restriction system protein
MKKSKGPQFLRFFIPTIEVLKELGGSGRPAEVTDLVIEKLNISEKEQGETIKSGSSRVRNQVAWARLYLVKSGLMDSSQRGVWSLTEKGLELTLTYKDVLNYFKDIQSQFKIREEGSQETCQEISNQNEEETIEFVDCKTELLNILKSLSPNGFERICQRLLRESGFLQVTVTGKSSDGGIDGHGILQVNPFVSFKVMFQCKRYQGAVTPSHVRDFRGAMEGRADKGIILTTGSFTTEAKKEARRDGATPIEIVDGEKLIEMFETLQFGLKPKTDYDVNYDFFSEYR